MVELKTINGKKFCRDNWQRPIYRQLHVVFVMAIYYILPLAVILSTYLRIRLKLSEDSFLKSQIREDPTSTVQRRLEQNKKALKLLTPVVVAFSLLVLPINAIRVAVAFEGSLFHSFKYLRLVYNLSFLLLLANSSINCVIYAVVNKDFRSEFQRLLCCACLKRIYAPVRSSRRRFFSLSSTADPRTNEEMILEDPVFQEDENLEKSRRIARLLRKLSRYEVSNLVEDTDYTDTVHYCAYGDNVTIVVR